MILKLLAYLILIAFFSLEGLLRSGDKAKNIEPKKEDNKSTLFLLLAYFIVLFVSILFNILGIGSIKNEAVGYIGLILMLIGLTLRIWSMYTLKNFYTRTLLMDNNHELIKTGPYALIRHPGYLGSLLIWGFAGLAIQNMVVFITALLILSATYIYRINNEEKMLEDNFGAEFTAYKKHTYRLIPLVW
jgi:protein-S-isoprenylcysteine O-methyltransferase Ste14